MVSASLLLQVFLGGLTSGSVYALVALGFALIYNVSSVVNLAQGEFVTLGALIMLTLTVMLKVPMIPGFFITVIVVALIAVLFERLAIRPAWGSPVATLLIISIGVSIFLKGLAMVIWGKDPLSAPAFSGEKPFFLWGATVTPQALWVIGFVGLIALGLWYFFGRTLYGKAVLAVSENQAAASLVGINVRGVILFSFALSGAIGAMAGMAIAPITFITYDGGTLIGLKGFVAATVGGMGNNWGAVIGGILLGLLESFGAGFISSDFKDVFAFVILLGVLYYRPSGLFGKVAR